eukprot:scaffold145695_cov130-Phaeocystis_antarctica.AAC.1
MYATLARAAAPSSLPLRSKRHRTPAASKKLSRKAAKVFEPCTEPPTYKSQASRAACSHTPQEEPSDWYSPGSETSCHPCSPREVSKASLMGETTGSSAPRPSKWYTICSRKLKNSSCQCSCCTLYGRTIEALESGLASASRTTVSLEN